MSQITTHVLDTALGRPAEGIPVTLFDGEKEVGRGITNADGRVTDLVPEGTSMMAGTYHIRFETDAYLEQTASGNFYPYVEITFRINEQSSHYPVPLLLSPFGYSTYRGS